MELYTTYYLQYNAIFLNLIYIKLIKHVTEILSSHSTLYYYYPSSPFHITVALNFNGNSFNLSYNIIIMTHVFTFSVYMSVVQNYLCD